MKKSIKQLVEKYAQSTVIESEVSKLRKSIQEVTAVLAEVNSVLAMPTGPQATSKARAVYPRFRALKRSLSEAFYERMDQSLSVYFARTDLDEPTPSSAVTKPAPMAPAKPKDFPNA